MASLEGVCNLQQERVHANPQIQLPSVLFPMPLLKTIQDLELVGLIRPYFLYRYQVCVCSAMIPDAKIIYLSKCTTLVQTEIRASRHPGSRTVSLLSYI